MRRTLLLACLAALALPAAPAPARAEAAPPLRQAALAADLYARGLASGDALSVLAAARLRKASGLAPADGTAQDAADPVPTWQSMLDAAESLAAGDPVLLGLIADTRAETAKGVTSGPVYTLASVAAGTEARVAELAFRGGEYAEVYVEAAPGTDIDLAIHDAAGNLVCADTHASHVAYCGWTPASDGLFFLTLTNRDALPASYALMTN